MLSVLLKALLISLALLGSAFAADPELRVQAYTNSEPGTDFKSVLIKVFRTRDGRPMAQRATGTRRWRGNMRVGSFRLPVGAYRVELSVIDAYGKVVKRQTSKTRLRRRGGSVNFRFAVKADPKICQDRFARARRECGRSLGRCIAQREGLKTCQGRQTTCIRGATRARDRCVAR